MNKAHTCNIYIYIYIWFQICTLDINNPKDCAQKFISNQRIGMMIFVGIILSNLLKDLPKKQDQKNKQDGGKDCIK